MTKLDRPSWQHEDCPPWCEGGHAETDHPEDHIHRSAGIAIPVIMRRTFVTDGKLAHIVEATDLELGFSRAVDDSDTWVYLGIGEGWELELSLESARRIIFRTGSLCLTRS